ncbi:S-type pyocin domain-containing protein [Pseudomonas sp. NPDC089408]|uniref:S-type pyocin domain-containing protein n=1 Tax=Pseudomonas sp. NPDC089408 TaxID=3364465 RepID=UPI0037F43D27
MTSRRTLTSQELQEIYPAAPFSYDFESILSWDSPYTLPIAPPNIASLSKEALRVNSATIAKNVIQEIEATCPEGTPGFENYLTKHYSEIKKSHPNQTNDLYAQKKFLLLLYNKIYNQAIHHNNLYMAEHIYTTGIDDAALNFENIVSDYGGREKEFFVIEEDLHLLMSSITAAQIEIVLNRCLEKVKKEYENLQKKKKKTIRILQNNHNKHSEDNSITLNPNSAIELSTTLTTISIDPIRFDRLNWKLSSGIEEIKRLALAATPIFRLGIGLFFYSSELGNADLYHESALSMPAEQLIPDLPTNIHDIALKHGTIESPLRIKANLDTYILTNNANSANAEKKVPVRPLVMDKSGNSYTSIPSSDFPIRLSFPIHTVNGTSTTTPSNPITSDPYEGVNLRPVWIDATPLPAHELPNYKDCIYCFPPESGLSPLYVVFNSPYPGATTIGTFSGRPYNPDKAGGPIEKLDWREARITATGVELVKLHISRFTSSDANKIMIDRLEKILQGEVQASDIDKRFFTHEIRELERFRALGIADKILPTDRGEAWNNTHAATLEDYQLGSEAELLYTTEALEADLKQLEREY